MFRLIALACAAGLLAGCSTNNSSSADEVASSRPTPTSTPSQTVEQKPEDNRPALSESFLAADVDECRLSDARLQRRQPNNVGFPLSETWIPVEGIANYLVVPVTFSDIAADEVPLTFMQDTSTKVSDWYQETSRGKLEVKFEIVENWVELNEPSTNFVFSKGKANVGPTEEDRIRNQLQTQMTESVIAGLGDKTILKNKDALIMVFPERAKAVETSILQRGVDLRSTPEVETMMVWGTGGDNSIKELEWAVWIHESLHDQGLPLHAPGNGSDFGLGQNQYAQSSTLSGWEQFKLGWLTDEDVLCLDAETVGAEGWQFNLGIFELPDSKPTIAVIKLSKFEAIVIESRRPVGYSERYKNLKGAVVYKVDTRLDNDRASECCEDYGNDPAFNKWAFLLTPDHIADSKQSTGNTSDKFIFGEGDEVTIENYVLRLEQSAGVDSFAFGPK